MNLLLNFARQACRSSPYHFRRRTNKGRLTDYLLLQNKYWTWYIFMRAQIGYDWLNQYTNLNGFWVEDSLNWDIAFSLATTDYTLYSILTSPFLMTTYIYLESFSKLAFIDVWAITEGSEQYDSQELYCAVIWDVCEMLQPLSYSTQFLHYSDYQSLTTPMVHNTPELVIPLLEFIDYSKTNSTFRFILASGSTIFNDWIIVGISKLTNLGLMLLVGIWGSIIYVSVLRLTKWNNPLESYWTRLLLYFNSMSKENRLQLEATLITVMLFTFLHVFNIITFKDWYEESIERVTLWLFYTFLGVYVFFLYKNSHHYFSFLEASTTNRRSTSFFVQFGKDASNSAVLWLRFLALLVRLNIYDTLDDVLDSNYIFACDFQDEVYTSDTWARFYNFLAYDSSYCVSKNPALPYNLNYPFDLFSIYFTVVLKFTTFVLFALEEIARVLLAFFILYLVIFEMQAVNRSYTEDRFIWNQRV